MQLFYQSNISEKSKEIVFNKEESRHIGKSLRKQLGDTLYLTNGKGLFFEAELLSTNPKKCMATIISYKKEPPRPYHLHLVVAPTKSNDRYEWFLEKVTEIGVTEITPIICEHSERKSINSTRFEKIIQNAMKQSLKAFLPILNPAVKYKDFVKSDNIMGDRFIAHCEDSQKISFKSVLQKKQHITVMIGPEGDFSHTEIKFATKNGFEAVSLGLNRLRTETAAIVACQSVSFVNEL